MGKRSRDKGVRGEREVLEILRKIDPEAKRVPLSGAATGYKGDIELPTLGRRVEVKRRENSFKLLDRWLEDADFVVFRADRQDWRVWIPLETFIEMIRRGC